MASSEPNHHDDGLATRPVDVNNSDGLVDTAGTAPLQREGDSSAPVAWTISFGPKRKISAREAAALQQNRSSRTARLNPEAAASTTTETVVSIDEVPIDVDALIPKQLTTTRDDMLQRVHMDVPRLLCVTKQYPRGCGVASLTSVWNLLYSRLGYGSLPPVSQEEVMSILGFSPPFDTIRWGPFCGNTTLLRWFHHINAHFGVRGKAYYLYKVHGHGRTPPSVTPSVAGQQLRETLRNPQAAVIYHCHNHYMVPVGFQMIPKSPLQCYAPHVSDDDASMTVFIGEVSRGKHPAMYAVKWADIVTDLSTALPEFVNIRHLELGVQTRKAGGQKKAPPLSEGSRVAAEGAEAAGETNATAVRPPPPSVASVPRNLHCLLVFRSDLVEDDLDAFMHRTTEDGDADEDGEEGMALDAADDSTTGSGTVAD